MLKIRFRPTGAQASQLIARTCRREVHASSTHSQWFGHHTDPTHYHRLNCCYHSTTTIPPRPSKQAIFEMVNNSGPLSSKYGPETFTKFSGNALNRLSFLREDRVFLENALHASTARFLPLKDCNPMLNAAGTHLLWQTLAEVQPAVGEPYKRTLEEITKEFDPVRDGSGCSHAQIVFLGMDESNREASVMDGQHRRVVGEPRFALDITVHDHALPELKNILGSLEAHLTASGGNTIDDFRSVMYGTPLSNPLEYNIVAEARIILDWINRVRFCGGCGRRNLSVWGGFKLLCPTSYAGLTSCPTHGKVTNLSFPRTDCCVIMAVISHDGSRVLIGRGKRFRGNMYSCLAGFLESGESIEDCVRREVYEESGVQVGRVLMHSSQPWPYPANLMIGCLAEVVDDTPEASAINLSHDEELVDAKWVTKDDLRLLCEGKGDFDYTVPPNISIAWQLLNAVAKNEY